MKTKLSQLWQSLGVNAKAILITALFIIALLLFFGILTLIIIILENYVNYALIAGYLYLAYTLYKFIKQWLQQNKEN